MMFNGTCMQPARLHTHERLLSFVFNHRSRYFWQPSPQPDINLKTFLPTFWHSELSQTTKTRTSFYAPPHYRSDFNTAHWAVSFSTKQIMNRASKVKPQKALQKAKKLISLSRGRGVYGSPARRKNASLRQLYRVAKRQANAATETGRGPLPTRIRAVHRNRWFASNSKLTHRLYFSNVENSYHSLEESVHPCKTLINFVMNLFVGSRPGMEGHRTNEREIQGQEGEDQSLLLQAVQVRELKKYAILALNALPPHPYSVQGTFQPCGQSDDHQKDDYQHDDQQQRDGVPCVEPNRIEALLCPNGTGEINELIDFSDVIVAGQEKDGNIRDDSKNQSVPNQNMGPTFPPDTFPSLTHSNEMDELENLLMTNAQPTDVPEMLTLPAAIQNPLLPHPYLWRLDMFNITLIPSSSHRIRQSYSFFTQDSISIGSMELFP